MPSGNLISVAWLRRNAFPIDRESYFYRPLDLLGLCLGARYCPDLNDGDRGWLKDVLQAGRSRLQQETFAYILGTFSAMQLGIVWPIEVPPATDQPLAMLGLLHWLFRETEFATAQRVAAPSADLEIALLQQALTTIGDVSDVAEAALVLHSTSEVVNKAIQSQVQESWAVPVNDRDAIRVVTNLCDRFPIMANTLKARHDGRSTLEITDEYDVQDLFTAMLKLHFDDVRPEEWDAKLRRKFEQNRFLIEGVWIGHRSQDDQEEPRSKGTNESAGGGHTSLPISFGLQIFALFCLRPRGALHNPKCLGKRPYKKAWKS